MNLIDDIGFGAVDTGSLAEGGRRQQPGAPLCNQVMTAREGREALAGPSTLNEDEIAERGARLARRDD